MSSLDRSKANRIYSNEFNLQEEDWQNIYLLPHKIPFCNKAKEFQFKVLHRYLGTNQLLFKIGKVESPRCNFCFLYEQNIEHLLVFCNISRNFWLQVSN